MGRFMGLSFSFWGHDLTPNSAACASVGCGKVNEPVGATAIPSAEESTPE
jgi:hypothetical protein